MSQEIGIERRLAAVLAADVAGFSRLTEADEVGTMRLLAAQRAILDSAIARHRGRIANTAGDSVLAEFPSAVNAVQCAVEVQQALRDAAEAAPADRRVLFRIGIHVGDVMVRGGDLLGTGVNVAARLEAMAEAGGIVLSAAAHEQVKKILPLAYTDLGAQSVKNIEEPMRAFAIGATQAASVAIPSEGRTLPLPDKPSIAVLPFQNMYGDPEQEYFADGMVEDITTALSRFSALFVIARNSSFTYKGKAIDVRQVGRELGVRYVLEGSVRKVGDRVRITGQLIEAGSGLHLWADKFDGSLANIFDLHDDVATRVVGAIVPRLTSAALERTKQRPPELWDSYDHFLRANDLHRQHTPEGARQALEQFRVAIKLSPNFGAAWAGAAVCIYTIRNVFNLPITEELRSEALQMIGTGLALAGDDEGVLANAAFVLANLNNEFERGAALASQAIAINSNYANGWNAVGWMNLCLGNVDIASDAFARAIRLNPIDPILVPNVLNGLSCARMLSGPHDEGIVWAEKVLAHRPLNLLGLIAFTGNALQLGRDAEAAAAAAKIRNAYPKLNRGTITSLYPLRKQEHRSILDRVIDCVEGSA